MENLDLLIDLHIHNERQGPGSERTTRTALRQTGLIGHQGLKVADIGCGTGASTLVLAKDLDAKITAVDFLPNFLEALEQRADAKGLSERIETRAQSMDALTFEPESLDMIWSEGAI